MAGEGRGFLLHGHRLTAPSRLIITQLLNRQLLLILDLLQALELIGQTLKHHFLLIDKSLQLLLLLPAIVFFALDLIARPNGPQLLVLDFLGLLLEDFVEGGDHLIELHDFYFEKKTVRILIMIKSSKLLKKSKSGTQFKYLNRGHE